MKPSKIAPFVLIIVNICNFCGCSDKGEVVIADEFQPYLAELEACGANLSSLRSVDFADGSDWVGLCEVYTRGTVKYSAIKVDQTFWARATLPMRRSLILHEVLHCTEDKLDLYDERSNGDVMFWTIGISVTDEDWKRNVDKYLGGCK